MLCLFCVASGFSLFFAIESGWRWFASVPFWLLALGVFRPAVRFRSTRVTLWLIPVSLLSFALARFSAELISEGSSFWAFVVWFIAIVIGGVSIAPEHDETQKSLRSDRKPRDARKLHVWNDLLDREDVLIVDTETTGLDAKAEVIEIAAVDTCGKIRIHALTLPAGPVPREA